MYQYGLEAAFFAKKGAEVQHGDYAILEKFETFAEAAKSVLGSLDYSDTIF